MKLREGPLTTLAASSTMETLTSSRDQADKTTEKNLLMSLPLYFHNTQMYVLQLTLSMIFFSSHGGKTHFSHCNMFQIAVNTKTEVSVAS